MPSVAIIQFLKEEFVGSKVAIFRVSQRNWLTTIWLSKARDDTFMCSADEEVQEGGISRDLPAKDDLRSGSEIYDAVAEFTDNYELWLEDADWRGIAKALSTFNHELEREFLVAWQERHKGT